MEDLKPCPFCGGEAEYKIEWTAFVYQAAVRCRSCGAGGQAFRVSDLICAKDCAISAWNRRIGDG